MKNSYRQNTTMPRDSNIVPIYSPTRTPAYSGRNTVCVIEERPNTLGCVFGFNSLIIRGEKQHA
jgi:hypothetical protein